MASESAWPLTVALAAVLFVTLVPISGPVEEVSVVCLICGPYGTADFVLNILLFVPLGFLAAYRFAAAGRIMALVLAATAGIEMAQLLIPGRHPTAGDIVANFLGGGLGIMIARGLVFRPLGRLFPFALVAILVGTIWAYEPGIRDSTFVGQWTPVLPSFDPYDGRVSRAYSGGVELPDGLLKGAAHDSVLAAPDGVPITVQFIAGAAPDRLAPILRVTDRRESEVLLVGAHETAIVVRMRRVAQRLRLHGPQARFDGAHPPAGTSSAVRFERRGREYCIGTPATAACQSSVTPARGWFLLTGFTLPRWASSLADALWLGGLAMLLVFAPRGTVRWIPAVAYAALWVLLEGSPGWLPGFMGILTASAGITVFDRTPRSARPPKGSV